MNFLRRNLWWVLAIIPFAFLLYTVVKFNVPVPFLDEWDLVPLLQKMYAGNLTLTDLWGLHNEHRLFFPQLIMLGLARLTRWDIRYEMATSIVFAVGIFLVSTLQLRSTARKLALPGLYWAVPLFSVIFFSMSQYQNWLWGWQLEILLSVFSVIGAIVLLANPPVTWLRLVGAAVLGVIASYSFGNGGVVWPVGLFLLWFAVAPGKERRVRLTVWLLLGSLTMVLYFYQYERLEEHPPLILLFHEPVQYLIYVVKYLGNICAQYGGLHSPYGGFAFVYGLGAICTSIWAIFVLMRNKLVEFKTLLPFVAMSLYSLGSAFVIGVGRVGLGSDQAVHSRYCTVTAPFWASLVMFLLLVLSVKPTAKARPRIAGQKQRKESDPMYRGVAKWLLGILSALLVTGSILGINGAVELSQDQEVGRERLVTLPIEPTRGIDYSKLGALHPRPQLILERFPFLKERRLSVFRDEPDGTPQSQH